MRFLELHFSTRYCHHESAPSGNSETLQNERKQYQYRKNWTPRPSMKKSLEILLSRKPAKPVDKAKLKQEAVKRSKSRPLLAKIVEKFKKNKEPC